MMMMMMDMLIINLCSCVWAYKTLHIASANGHLAIVQYLIESAHGYINIPDDCVRE